MNPILQRNRDRQPKAAQPQITRPNRIRENCIKIIQESLGDEKFGINIYIDDTFVNNLEETMYRFAQSNENSKQYRDQIISIKSKLKGLKNKAIKTALLNGTLDCETFITQDLAVLQNEYKCDEEMASKDKKNSSKLPRPPVKINFNPMIVQLQPQKDSDLLEFSQEKYNTDAQNSKFFDLESQNNEQFMQDSPKKQFEMNQENIHNFKEIESFQQEIYSVQKEDQTYQQEKQIILQETQNICQEELKITQQQQQPIDAQLNINEQIYEEKNQQNFKQDDDEQLIFKELQSQLDNFNQTRKDILQQSCQQQDDNNNDIKLSNSSDEILFEKNTKFFFEKTDNQQLCDKISVQSVQDDKIINEKILPQKLIPDFPSQTISNMEQKKLNEIENIQITQIIDQQYQDILEENRILKQALITFQKNKPNNQTKIDILEQKLYAINKESEIIKDHLNKILSENSRFKTQYQSLKNALEHEKEWQALQINSLQNALLDQELKFSKQSHQLELQVQKTQQKQDKIDKDAVIGNLLILNKQGDRNDLHNSLIIKKEEAYELKSQISYSQSQAKSVLQKPQVVQNESQFQESLIIHQNDFTNNIYHNEKQDHSIQFQERKESNPEEQIYYLNNYNHNNSKTNTQQNNINNSYQNINAHVNNIINQTDNQNQAENQQLQSQEQTNVMFLSPSFAAQQSKKNPQKKIQRQNNPGVFQEEYQPQNDYETPLKRQNSLTSLQSLQSIQTEGHKKKLDKKRIIPNTMFE